MKLKRVLVKKAGVKVIDIDTGTTANLVAGRTYEVEPVEHKTRGYYVLTGTRLGSVDRFWQDLERDGKGDLVYAREADDPVIDGVRLPISSRQQLTESQFRGMVIGRLVKGKFLCTGCAAGGGHAYPQSVDVMPVHVLPYSQKCGRCGLQVVAVWKASKGGWLNLYD